MRNRSKQSSKFPSRRQPIIAKPATSSPPRNVEPGESDRLIALQCDVLEWLEENEHPAFTAADTDKALWDSASDSDRKAWLMIYGPLTTITLLP